MDNKFTFTKAAIAGLPTPETDRVTYHDTKQSGLQLRVSKIGKKTFGLRTDLHGKTVRVTLGVFPKVSVENARKLAKNHLSSIADGKDPNKLKKAKQSKSITLQQCLDEYIKSHTNIKDNTAKGYRNTLTKYLADWLKKRKRLANPTC